ncbi:MAG: Bug family tripartite tricarboxylate transporter substrate binding protein [Lautropia sp.]
MLGEQLSKDWGRPFVIDNRPGAGGTLGARLVMRAQPDGYTLLHASSGPMVIGPHVIKSAGYDPRKDFTPIINVAGVAQAIVVRSDSRLRTIADLVSAAKAAPATLDYGSGGNGSTQHLTMEFFSQRAGMRLVHVPYKGSGPAYTDLLGGQIDILVDSLPSTVPFVQSGQARVLGISTAQRDPALPDVPTLIESGYPEVEVLGWLGLVGPAGLPRALRDQINSAVNRALAMDAIRQSMAKLGMQQIGGSADAFEKFIASEYVRWGDVVRQGEIKGE